jgi:D-tyrosyl-tRNA(Tyr) deacylase
LYERFLTSLRQRGLKVESGEFGAMMDVELVNYGPVTLWLER